MGIPSYFKHIIQNHRSIIKELDTAIITDSIKELNKKLTNPLVRISKNSKNYSYI